MVWYSTASSLGLKVSGSGILSICFFYQLIEEIKVPRFKCVSACPGMKGGSRVEDTNGSWYLLVQPLHANGSTAFCRGVSVSDRNIVGHEKNFLIEHASAPWNLILSVRGWEAGFRQGGMSCSGLGAGCLDSWLARILPIWKRKMGCMCIYNASFD
jgi:hypothetical protein